jgi:hypothetical protein
MPTIQGAGSGTLITVNVSNALQQLVGQQILNAASTLFPVSGTAVGQYSIADAAAVTLAGNPTITGVQYALLTGGDAYSTNGAPVSFVVGADGSVPGGIGGNNDIVNNSPSSALVAITGAGPNTLAGLAGANQFVTGAGGVDNVFLDGVGNALSSNGVDNVNVGGPSTITASQGAVDNVNMTQGTLLAFINGSTSTTSSIQGAAGGVVVVAGPGNTSITSGAGPEAFYVDTSVGNVTLNANLQSQDAFTFVKDATAGRANVTVNNFAAGDAVNVHGYSGAQYTVGSNAAGSAVLSLTDGSTVTFTGVSAGTLAAVVKPV